MDTTNNTIFNVISILEKDSVNTPAFKNNNFSDKILFIIYSKANRLMGQGTL
jgi:hypothetical protein